MLESQEIDREQSRKFVIAYRTTIKEIFFGPKINSQVTDLNTQSLRIFVLICTASKHKHDHVYEH